MRSLALDVRDAIRGLVRDRGFAATVVLTLALAIGATTAMFSIVDSVLLAPLPYREPQQLVAVREVWRELAGRGRALEVNERHFEYWRLHATGFDGLAQFSVRPANLTGAGEAAQITLVRCSGSLFDVLRVQAVIGRTLATSDEADGAADVAVITASLWRQRFNANPRVLGERIIMDGRPYSIIGVLPDGFRLPRRGQLTSSVDAFTPLPVQAGWSGEHNNEAIGRLRENTTLDAASAQLDVLQAQVAALASAEAHQTVTLASNVVPLTEHVTGTSRQGLLLLLAAIAGVLLMACANLASLSLTRALGRLRDVAIRAALGASRQQLVVRTLLDSVLLSIAGGALGLWVAWMALGVFARTAPTDLPRVDEIGLDPPAVIFAVVLSLFTALLLALLPIARVLRADVQNGLRAGSRTVAGTAASTHSHAVLLTVQVGVSVTLLVVTGLIVTSFARLLQVDRGFQADRVLAVDIALPAARYAEPAPQRAAYERLIAGVRALPGVETVTTTSLLPMRGQGQVNFVVPEGRVVETAERATANFRLVAPEFFETLGIAVRRGRVFREDEQHAGHAVPALISEPTAAQLWPDEDPLGKRFTRGAGEQRFEVVGTVADARTTALDRAQPLMVYVPYWWQARTSTSILIKTSAGSTQLLTDVRRVVHGIDPEIAIGATRPLDDLVEASMAGRRYQTRMFVAFGAAALCIAIIGVYAVTTQGVSRRRREMNIRVALGARASQVLALIVWQGTGPLLAGVLFGVAAALALGGAIASLLFDVHARDPFIVGTAIAIVGTAGILTCALAARRSLQLDPAAALREE